MLKPKNDELERAVKSVVDFARTLNRGDTLLHDKIEELSGCLRGKDGQWGQVIVKVKRALLSRPGIALLPVVSVGYRLCEKSDQIIGCPRRRRQRAVRQLNRGVKEVAAIPQKELSMHLQVARAITEQSLIAERRALKRSLRYHREEFKTSDVPLRPF